MIVDIVDLKLSAQSALLGHVFSKLRAICVNSSENLIYVCFYCDGEITDEEKELCECILDEIIADFCCLDDIEFETPIIRLKYPEEMPLNGDWVYYRHEV